MLKWYKLEGNFPEEDFVEQIKVNGKKLCLVRHQGHVFVVQNSCPHAGGILSGGTCKNGYLICPIHRWEYNLQTGRGAEGQGDYIDTYPVETRPDGIYVGLKESWIKKLFS
ncbi:Rieske (2Fe-2S) protein [Pedobacter sp. PLR]|uniref:Rieske (2Fe-2S) protein n=1 Tax=Pedobacter sp. PLR TaxID=2994465 RepID=UPI0022454794|nr:Rieske (2Fe-2S) protein [Pedobacter sp. PLR]MCX2449806.1 Rieske (2Fe-2S) protein [Pedobacter sp. PLR]